MDNIQQEAGGIILDVYLRCDWNTGSENADDGGEFWSRGDGCDEGVCDGSD